MANETVQNPANEVLDSFLQPQRSPEEFNATKGLDSGTARVPAPQVPSRPSGAEPGTTGEEPEAPKLDGGDLLAASWFNHVLQKDRAAGPARPAAAPGSFAHKLRS